MEPILHSPRRYLVRTASIFILVLIKTLRFYLTNMLDSKSLWYFLIVLEAVTNCHHFPVDFEINTSFPTPCVGYLPLFPRLKKVIAIWSTA